MTQSFNMEPATATDVCDGMFKSKNITVHGNATIVKQTGPQLVYSVEQWKALELMAIVEEKFAIAQRDGLDTVQSSLNYQARSFY